MPQPKPTALKIMQGTAQPCRMVNEAKPEIIIPVMPRGMHKYAQKFWKANVEELARVGLFTKIDSTLFETAARTYALMMLAHDKCFWKHATSAEWNLYLKFNAQMLQYYKALGMTPAARSRINVEVKQDFDDFDSYLASNPNK